MKKLLIFLLGAGVGATGAWFYMKQKYQSELQKELSKQREYYEKVDIKEEPVEEVSDDISEEEIEEIEEKENVEEPKKGQAFSKPDLVDYAKMFLKDANKEDLGETVADILNKDEEEREDFGYTLIADSLFEELYIDGYEIVELTCWDDGICTNINDEVEFYLTEMNKNLTFEDFDSNGYLYLRNDEDEIVYEVNKENRRYEDVFPYQ